MPKLPSARQLKPAGAHSPQPDGVGTPAVPTEVLQPRQVLAEPTATAHSIEPVADNGTSDVARFRGEGKANSSASTFIARQPAEARLEKVAVQDAWVEAVPSASAMEAPTTSTAARPKGQKARAASFPWELMLPALFSGGILAGGLSGAVPIRMEERAEPIARAQAEPVVILPAVFASQTWQIEPSRAFSFAMLQGQFRRSGVVVGQAPLAGQISRVRVRAGQRVEVGDRVLTISSGGQARQAPRPQEGRQSRAEEQQVEAVRRKDALQRRIEAARAESGEAQLRLDAANQRLAEARGLLARISRGENVPSPDAPARSSAQPSEGEAPTTRKRRTRRSKRGASRREERREGRAESRRESAQDERRAALAQSQEAQDAAQAASKKAKSLFYAASSTQGAVRTAKARLDNAQSNLKIIEEQFAGGTVKADAVEQARGTVSEAQSEVSEAEKKSTSAQDEARSAQREADLLQEKAAQSAGRATRSLRDLKLAQSAETNNTSADSDADSGTPEPGISPQEGSSKSSARRMLSVSDAATLVRQAIRDANVAARNAQRLQARVESFKRSASTISSDIQSSSRNLEQAQQQVMENTIESNLQSVRAPASGTVLSVAEVAQEVGEGETIIRIARGSQTPEATLEDRSDAWKRLREGMTLPARLLPRSAIEGAALAATVKTTAAMSGVIPFSSQGEAIVLRVSDIEAPLSPGKPAQIHVTLASALNGGLRGKRVACLVAKNSSPLLSIPAACVARGSSDQPIVAVLRAPDSTSTGEISLASDGASGRASDSVYQIEWRPVALSDALPTGASTSPQGPASASPTGEKMKKVISGLAPGERILRDAAQWQQQLQNVQDGSARVRLALNAS